MEIIHNLIDSFYTQKQEHTADGICSLYSETLDLISEFIRNVSDRNLSPLSNLKICLHKLKNLQKDTPRYKYICRLRNNLIDDLRYKIVFNLGLVDKRNKILLKKYHQILHLISLLNKNNQGSYTKINSWLNTNSMLLDDEDELHAMRGNFGKLSKRYPDLQDAFDELAILEADFREQKISEMEYRDLKYNWLNINKTELPERIFQIISGTYVNENVHWTEILCYKLAYNNQKQDIKEILNGMQKCIDKKDEIYYILVEDYDLLIQKSSDWLQFVLCFMYTPMDSFLVYNCITSIASFLFDIDWQISLDFFSYTALTNIYFEKAIRRIKMNPAIYDFLQRYACRNRLDSTVLNELYEKYLVDNRDYYNLCLFVNTHKKFGNIDTTGFILYLTENYEKMKEFFCEEFLNMSAGKYVVLYVRILKSDEFVDDRDIQCFFEYKYTIRLFRNICDHILNKDICQEKLIVKCLDYLVSKQKDLCLEDLEIYELKKQMIDKLHFMNCKDE